MASARLGAIRKAIPQLSAKQRGAFYYRIRKEMKTWPVEFESLIKRDKEGYDAFVRYAKAENTAAYRMMWSRTAKILKRYADAIGRSLNEAALDKYWKHQQKIAARTSRSEFLASRDAARATRDAAGGAVGRAANTPAGLRAKAFDIKPTTMPRASLGKERPPSSPEFLKESRVAKPSTRLSERPTTALTKPLGKSKVRLTAVKKGGGLIAVIVMIDSCWELWGGDSERDETAHRMTATPSAFNHYELPPGWGNY